MKIQPLQLTIRELTKGYEDKQEEGVRGYGGKLDIRPPYQREFIYKDKQRDAVINTVRQDYPLNVMYWSVRADGNFEIIDGQQRTVSICRYVNKDFSIKGLKFHNLQGDEQKQILDYKLTIYLCSGTDSERLDWFETINISGEELTPQELKNAVYSGTWVTDAKRYFSKANRPKLGDDYLSGVAIRQEFLETVIDWISNGDIKGYMSDHQDHKDAKELWQYFQVVIKWVKTIFPEYRSEMKGVPFGRLYNVHKDEKPDPEKLEKRISTLMEDEDVTNKKGIYTYVLNGKEKFLNIRAFTDKQKREAWERQKGICPKCKEKKKWKFEEMEGDHKKPWHDGGKTIPENCEMLCKEHNREKAGK